jgi:hypothetical protein
MLSLLQYVTHAQGGAVMNCARCQGLMIEDQFFDFQGTQGFMSMKGWRCMNCGHAVDPLIETNHLLHKARVLVQPCKEPESEHDYMYLRETIARIAA